MPAARIRATGMPIGALVNVAGGFRWGNRSRMERRSWDWLYRTNVKTALITCGEFLPDPARRRANCQCWRCSCRASRHRHGRMQRRNLP